MTCEEAQLTIVKVAGKKHAAVILLLVFSVDMYSIDLYVQLKE